MNSIMLREVDDELFGRLKTLAKASNISVESEILSLLRHSVIRPARPVALARADAIAAMTPKGIKQTDSTQLVREDRER